MWSLIITDCSLQLLFILPLSVSPIFYKNIIWKPKFLGCFLFKHLWLFSSIYFLPWNPKIERNMNISVNLVSLLADLLITWDLELLASDTYMVSSTSSLLWHWTEARWNANMICWIMARGNSWVQLLFFFKIILRACTMCSNGGKMNISICLKWSICTWHYKVLYSSFVKL